MLIKLLGVCGLMSSYMVVVSGEEVKSVLYLVLAYINMGGILILKGGDYIGMIIMVVYISAVMILFLFVVMMLIQREVKESKGGLLGILGSLSMLGLTEEKEISELKIDRERNVELIGEVLYREHIGEVLLGGLVLLLALIGCIRLSR